MYKTLDAPLSAHIEINMSCNQKCRHCYNFWREDNPSLNNPLHKDLASRIVSQLSLNKVFHVILNGGEPLMSMDSLLFIMRELSKKTVSFSLNSNLTLLKKEGAAALREAGLQTVLTSLLSCDEKTHDYLAATEGSHKRVLAGIEIARSSGISIAVNMVVTKNNLHQIYKTGLFAKDLGAFAFSATRAMAPRPPKESFIKELSLSPKEVKIIIEQLLLLKETGLRLESLVPYPGCFFESAEAWSLLGGRSCSAGKTSIAFSSTGEIRACPHHETVYGSIAKNDLSTIWQNLSLWRNGKMLPKACKDCPLIAKCGGGCRVASINGNVCGEDSIMQREFLDEGVFAQGTQNTPGVLIAETTKLRMRKKCRIRNDKEMSIVNTGGIKNTFVTNETAAILGNLNEKRVIFTPATLRESKGINMEQDRYHQFLSKLVIKDVLEIVL